MRSASCCLRRRDARGVDRRAVQPSRRIVRTARCSAGCISRDSVPTARLEVIGNAKFPVNEGGLCVKGWSAAATLDHPDRLRTPLVRGANGQLEPATWDGGARSRGVELRRRPAALRTRRRGGFGGGSLTNEKAYLLGKFARVALGTANIDYNGRFCMSSAAAAQSMAFGIDRGLPFPLADIPHAKAILLVGSNVGRDDAADHAVLRGAAGERRPADRRRSAPDADRRSGRRAICRSVPDRMRRSPTGCCTCSCATA